MATTRKGTRKTVRAEHPPAAGAAEVLLDVELTDGSLWLVLANASDLTAFDVAVAFRGPLMGVGGERDITEMRLFRRLPLLRPRREIRVFVDVARSFFARRQPTRLEARVSWRSRAGDRVSRTFTHDLAIWEDFGEIR
jgi:hypothetical protein